MTYSAHGERYDTMTYNRLGRSGLKLPAVSLGLWHGFGGNDSYENGRAMVLRSFDLGITHFDLANNYGPPTGSAEQVFGRILKSDLSPYRDEMVIATKAGYHMFKGPYGEWGSRKNMLASLDASLKRMGLDYVDIYYSHRFDPNTPLEETMGALDSAVRQGKALYVGISNYNRENTIKAIGILRELGTPCLIHQTHFSMFSRAFEETGVEDALREEGVGAIAYSPLARGLLTDRYFGGIPADSRAAGTSVFLKPDDVTEARVAKAKLLNEIAAARGQTLAQMALAWVMRRGVVASALIGASRVEQIDQNVGVLSKLEFEPAELDAIEAILNAPE